MLMLNMGHLLVLHPVLPGQTIARLTTTLHTTTQAYRTPDSQHVKLFCCGFYEEIMVVEPFSLEILFRLSSRINSDWISAFHVIRPRNRQDDVVLAITTTGAVKASAPGNDLFSLVSILADLGSLTVVHYTYIHRCGP